MEKSMSIGATSREAFLARDVAWCKKQGVAAGKENHAIVVQFISTMDDESFKESIVSAAVARNDILSYDDLSEQDKQSADRGGGPAGPRNGRSGESSASWRWPRAPSWRAHTSA